MAKSQSILGRKRDSSKIRPSGEGPVDVSQKGYKRRDPMADQKLYPNGFGNAGDEAIFQHGGTVQVLDEKVVNGKKMYLVDGDTVKAKDGTTVDPMVIPINNIKTKENAKIDLSNTVGNRKVFSLKEFKDIVPDYQYQGYLNSGSEGLYKNINKSKYPVQIDTFPDGSIVYRPYTYESAETSFDDYKKLSQNNKPIKATPIYKRGGVIEDNRGQWDHPGEVTKINSPNITMRGVDYPVLGVSDTGHQQLMMPGHDYSYYGKSVTEYPIIAQKGTTANKERAERLYKQIAPSSFIDVSNYVNYATGKNRDWYADPRSEEAWKMYLGLNDKPKYIAESKYKNENPAAKFAPNTKFYKIDQEAENQLVDYFKDKLKPGQHLTVSERELESLDNIDKKSGYGPFALFQNFNVGKGQDKQGEYIYYNDTYDFPGPMQMMLKGNPYEFYNKIYLPKGKSKEDFDESYYPNKMMEESMKGWWQKEKGGTIKAEKGVVIRNADGTITTYDPSSEEYRKLYESGQIGAYDKSNNAFYPTGSLPVVTVNAIRPKSFKDFNRRYSDQLAKDIGSDFSAGSFFQALTQPILQYPQAALTYALDPKSNVLPGKALGIDEEKHPWLTMLVNGVADPINLAGMGLADDALKIISKLNPNEIKALQNAYKINPWAFKLNEANWYRQVGKSAIDDALSTGLVREAGEEVSPRMFQEFQDQLVRMQGSGMDAALASRRPASPFFGKGELFYPMGRKPVISKTTGKLSKNPAGAGSSDYLIETALPNESFQPAYVKGMGLGVPTEIGQTAILKPNPDLRNLENFKLYKQDWLKGYKEIPKKAKGGTVKVLKEKTVNGKKHYLIDTKD